jgi:DNA-binding CsgD family transcriptional regulator
MSLSLAPMPRKPSVNVASTDFPSLISSIGEAQFDASLVGWLNKTCGAEHTCLFYFTGDKLTGLATASIDGASQNYQDMAVYLNEGLWQSDPSFKLAQAEMNENKRVSVRTDIASLRNRKLREYIYERRGIRDRLILCGPTQNGNVVLTMCSSDCDFASPDRIELIESHYDMLFALLAKHIDVSHRGTDASVALTTLAEIQLCISEQMSTMPRREAEVCGRAIYGMSTLGISLDLGISQETVMTYRKRAYSRLEIATQRELFLWYLKLWSQWRGRRIANTILH